MKRMYFFVFVFFSCVACYSITMSSYLGGQAFEHARDVAVDNYGNYYLVGGTTSSDFPVTQKRVNAGTKESGSVVPMDVFVTKFNSANQLIWSIKIGGPNYDRAYAVEITPDGNNIYVAGRAGRGFPVTYGVLQTVFRGGMEAATYGNEDGFVLRLAQDPANSRAVKFVWATYFGTSDPNIVRDLALGPDGIYIASSRASGTYQTNIATKFKNGPKGSRDAVIGKLSYDGKYFLWGSYVGGTSSESGENSVVASGTSVYLLCSSSSANAYSSRRKYAGGVDFILTKFSSTGSVSWATYFGGSGNETVETHDLAVLSTGDAIITGGTTSSNYPTTDFSGYHGSGGSGTGLGTNYPGDCPVTKISANGYLMVSALYGGRYGEACEGIAVDNGTIYLSGSSYSSDFISLRGVSDGFILSVDFNLARVGLESMGGSGMEHSRALAAKNYVVVAAGETQSSNLPVRSAYQSTYHGATDVFFWKK